MQTIESYLLKNKQPMLVLTVDARQTLQDYLQVQVVGLSGDVAAVFELSCGTHASELVSLTEATLEHLGCRVALVLPDGRMLRDLCGEITLHRLLER